MDVESHCTALDKAAEDACTWILAKWQALAVRALAFELTRAVHALPGMSPKEEEDDARTYSSGSELIVLNPYCVFDRYVNKEDKAQGEGEGKGQGRLWVNFVHQICSCQILVV